MKKIAMFVFVAMLFVSFGSALAQVKLGAKPFDPKAAWTEFLNKNAHRRDHTPSVESLAELRDLRKTDAVKHLKEAGGDEKDHLYQMTLGRIDSYQSEYELAVLLQEEVKLQDSYKTKPTAEILSQLVSNARQIWLKFTEVNGRVEGTKKFEKKYNLRASERDPHDHAYWIYTSDFLQAFRDFVETERAYYNVPIRYTLDYDPTR